MRVCYFVVKPSEENGYSVSLYIQGNKEIAFFNTGLNNFEKSLKNMCLDKYFKFLVKHFTLKNA